MKRLVMLVMLAAVAFSPAYADSLRPLELYGSFGVGTLLSGAQKTLGDTAILPRPDDYTSIIGMLGARAFLLDALGIEAFASLGEVTEQTNGYQPLTLYTSLMLGGGPALRWSIPFGRGSSLALVGGGGIAYTLPQIANDFSSLVASAGYQFYDTRGGMGWYARAGAAYYFNREWFIDIAGWYVAQAGEFSSGAQLNGDHILFLFGLGVSLL